jgi:hypothetical protein
VSKQLSKTRSPWWIWLVAILTSVGIAAAVAIAAFTLGAASSSNDPLVTTSTSIRAYSYSPEPTLTTTPDFTVGPTPSPAFSKLVATSLILVMDCATPPQRIFEDSVLGNPFLFDPRAQLDFTGNQATLTMWADGFKAKMMTVTRSAPVRGLEPVDLTHKFYFTGDPKKRSAQHRIKVVVRDSAGRKVTHTCSFPLRF